MAPTLTSSAGAFPTARDLGPILPVDLDRRAPRIDKARQGRAGAKR